jgi:hypothetical protein
VHERRTVEETFRQSGDGLYHVLAAIENQENSLLGKKGQQRRD